MTNIFLQKRTVLSMTIYAGVEVSERLRVAALDSPEINELGGLQVSREGGRDAFTVGVGRVY
jgi:hypothetical protein